MKENNNIDKLFKEKLSTGNFDYQKGYWAGAEKLITQQTAKAGGFLGLGKKALWLIAIPIVFGLSALVWLTNSAEEELAPMPSEETISNTASPENTSPKNPSPKNESVINTNARSESSAIDAEKKNVDTKNAEAVSVDQNSPVNGTEEQPIAIDEIEQSNTTIEEPKTRISGSTEVQPVIEPTTPLAENNESAHDAFKIGTNEEKGEEEPIDDAIESTNTSVENPNSNSPISKEDAVTPNQEANNANTIDEPQHLMVTESADEEEKPIILPHQKNKNWLISAGLEYSYFFVTRQLAGNETSSSYVDFRNTHENAQSITSLGASVLLERNNWLLSTGVFQTTINEDINYPSTLNVLTGVDNGTWNVQEIWNYSVDSNWVITGIYQGGWNYDTAWTLTYDSTYVEQWDSVYTEKEDPEVLANNGRHSMSYVEIPLLAGRSFGGEKLRFEIQAGGAVGILTGTQGSIYINPRLDGLVAQSNHQEQFREWQFNLLLRAGIRYDVTPQIQATLFPTLRYSLTNALKGDGIKQRYLGYGLSVGLSYRF